MVAIVSTEPLMEIHGRAKDHYGCARETNCFDSPPVRPVAELERERLSPDQYGPLPTYDFHSVLAILRLVRLSLI